ncbi:hypothetical protein [uncultured Cohaesibacter sp.]|uniref:hypothetical protein n=1 Tax=uncultured Cohaesibacter sp. TaxID=1002546 RepID=UPI00292EB6E1|nr:hypothetical protein [uncultured Cohaesibacter sp.]
MFGLRKKNRNIETLLNDCVVFTEKSEKNTQNLGIYTCDGLSLILNTLNISYFDNDIEDVMSRIETALPEANLREIHSAIMADIENEEFCEAKKLGWGLVAFWLLRAADCLHKDQKNRRFYEAYKKIVLNSWQVFSPQYKNLIDKKNKKEPNFG